METVQYLLENLLHLPARKKLLVLLVLASPVLAAVYLRGGPNSKAAGSAETPAPTPTARPWWVATPTPVDAPPTPIPIFQDHVLPPATQAPATFRGRVTTNLNVRGGPGTNYARVGGLPAGSEVKIYERNSESTWLRIGEGQWVASQFVELLP